MTLIFAVTALVKIEGAGDPPIRQRAHWLLLQIDIIKLLDMLADEVAGISWPPSFMPPPVTS